MSKWRKGKEEPILGFSKADKIGTFYPYDDALVVSLRIGGFDVKRVMVDQESVAKIMYLNLYKGLGLKQEDLSEYDTSLDKFNGKMVIPVGMVRLLVQMGKEVVEVDFIVVDSYSLYTSILARPWLHTVGKILSALHVKVKHPSKGGLGELLGCQIMVRQCMVVAIRHQMPQINYLNPNPTS